MKRLEHKKTAFVLLIIYAISAIFSLTGFAFASEEAENAVLIYKDIEGRKSTTESGTTKVSSRVYELLFGNSNKKDITYLIPGGEVFGIKIDEEFVSIASVCEPSAFKRGDKIISIDNKEVRSVSDVTSYLKGFKGGTVRVSIIRSGEKMTVTVTPKESGGDYKLGITLREVICGIGTVTFIDPENMLFGGLGHGVCESDCGEVTHMESGEVTGVILGGITKGECGKPGELSGVLNQTHSGTLYRNSECGVFGKLENYDISERKAIPVANKSEVKVGEAEIISTVKNGKTCTYKIEITEINHTASTTKSFKIKVTDPELIALTGGIVRGMSGSPIIQNGKLVGAVTHVMVADPTEGYGIFIENMLTASQVQPKAA